MSDGVVLQTQLNPFTNDNSIYSPSVSAMSLPLATKTKNRYLQQYGPFGLLVVLLIIILIIVAVIVSRISTHSAISIESSTTTTNSVNKSLGKNDSLVESIILEHMLVHLRQLTSRAIGTVAFNRTMDYLTTQLNKENSLTVQKYYFSVPRFELAGNPILMAIPNTSNSSLFTYPKDFVSMDLSKEARNWSLVNGRPLTVVPRLGCYIEDWNTTKEGDVALVRRGYCAFVQKVLFAMSKRASAVLVYNDGLTVDRFEPLNGTRAPRNNTIPALFLSYDAGMRLILNNVTHIYMKLEYRAVSPTIVTNICADTKLGNPNRTIVVGSHSDSVAAGSGLNDNGSGLAATLAIALNLARLLTYTNYGVNMHSRIKFCWWGGEEAGLLGSKDFVNRAKADGSLSLYSVNLNFDMLASPNFIFGVYDGKTADNQTTPPRALPGSNRITRLFTDYFDRSHLPWDHTEFSGRSDYGPFLAEGIACGGLFSGADDVKTQEQRDRYLNSLGSALSGMANADLDPCYHSKCDTLENLNTFAYLHMVKAAAHAIDYLAKLQDLNQWLYP
ncbi:hypothetical protein I4U23_009263 [Adineta vaga]|nr:hypothetical protein I4U23_009263 [Adineta vaga]